MNWRLVLGLTSAVFVLLALTLFGDLAMHVVFGRGYLYCPGGGGCVEYRSGRFVLGVVSLAFAYVFSAIAQRR